MDPETVKKKLEEGRIHLKFVARLYRRQLAAGRHFVHEHPAGAQSWKEECMKQLMATRGVQTVVSHQCEYGLTSADAQGVQRPVKKPTRWMSSSDAMIQRLSKRCSGHVHQQLVGGRAAQAAFYPLELVLEILRGMRDQANVEDQREREEGTAKQMSLLASMYPVPENHDDAKVSMFQGSGFPM